jgi:MFS family permease
MPFQRTLVAAWPLFFGLCMMMIGNGLQSTLLGVRATEAGFSSLATGFVMSAYYAGFMGGTRLVPRLLKNVGHIRVFAALAALASMMILVQGLFVMPSVWALMRVLTGFSYAGLYIVVESWLNNLATKETRGKILALYLLMTYLGIVAGQFLLNAADPHGDALFILTSIFISLSILPIALSKRPGPDFSAPKAMSLHELWGVSPLGMAAVTMSGLANSMLLSIGAVYAARRGFDTAAISTFMAAMVAGGAAGQLPIGMLSDRMERRRMILYVSVASCLCALLCFLASGLWLPLFYLIAFLLGATSMTIYGLCVAYTNDHLDPHQYVAASSAMLMVNGMGAIAGPMLSTGLMSAFGTGAYFPTIALVFLGMAGFTLYRMKVRQSPRPTSPAEFSSPPDAPVTGRIEDGR